jgi:hypothetical protein
MNEQTAAAGGGGIVLLIQLAVLILVVASVWKIFAKAGQPGWAAIVPIYNLYVLLKVAGKPGWWLILFFIPIVNLVMAIITYVALAQSFGKGAGFAVGIFFLPIIFLPILGFGSAQYVGSGTPPAAPGAPA